MANESYTPDEFDNPPVGPVGVHRGPKSLGSRMLPYAVVVLVAAVCGLAVWTLTSGFLENGRMPWQTDSSAVSSATASATSGSPVAVASPSSCLEHGRTVQFLRNIELVQRFVLRVVELGGQ